MTFVANVTSPKPDETRPGVRKTLLVAAVVLCFLTLITYLGTLRFGFVHDDNSQIVANPQIRSLKFLPQSMLTDVWSQKGEGHVPVYYRPLFTIWLLFLRLICGLNAWFWHLASMSLHATTTYLVFRLSQRLLGGLLVSVLVGSLFAIHPIHIESVCWISAADELLFSAFFVSSILALDRYLNEQKRSYLWLSLVLWSGALFSKETAVALLPVFCLWSYLHADIDASPAGRISGSLQKSVPFVLASAVYLGIRSFVLHGFGTELARHTWREVFFSGSDLLRFYALKLIFPLRLSPFYVNPIYSVPTARTWVTILFLLTAIVLGCWLVIRRERVITLGASLIILPLIPVLVGVRIFRDGDLAHDRYLYLPSVGLCLLFGLLFKQLWDARNSRRWLIGGVAGCLTIGLLALNLPQQRYYHDDEAFYNRGLEVGPENALVTEFLGSYYFRQEKIDLGLQQYRHAYDESPDNPEFGRRLAHSLFEAGHYSEVEPLLTKLVGDSPATDAGRKTLNLALAQTQMHLGKFGQAESTLKALIHTNDSMPKLHRTLGSLYEMQGRLYDASHEYEREYQVSGDIQSHRRAILLAVLPKAPKPDNPDRSDFRDKQSGKP